MWGVGRRGAQEVGTPADAPRHTARPPSTTAHHTTHERSVGVPAARYVRRGGTCACAPELYVLTAGTDPRSVPVHARPPPLP
jgi:hypothetical protein